ncbi:unnamed protein product [Ilex paraguariensis]|uniref:Uncharacterized protein n=1 Tax=Ilex paraguariensis TaxID=185542 RepID=A0ABC8T159_9AQUA
MAQLISPAQGGRSLVIPSSLTKSLGSLASSRFSLLRNAMSLALVQGYLSADEEEEQEPKDLNSSDDDDDDDDDDGDISNNRSGYKPLFDFSANPSSSSSLPSALDIFSQISAPPEFLNNCVQEPVSRDVDVKRWRHGGRRNRQEKKDLPAGNVI